MRRPFACCFPPPNIIPRDRAAALVDGIYAISMTLLVMTISVPSRYEHPFTARPVEAIVLIVLPDQLHFFRIHPPVALLVLRAPAVPSPPLP